VDADVAFGLVVSERHNHETRLGMWIATHATENQSLLILPVCFVVLPVRVQSSFVALTFAENA
jgi:hypothetical protein